AFTDASANGEQQHHRVLACRPEAEVVPVELAARDGGLGLHAVDLRGPWNVVEPCRKTVCHAYVLKWHLHQVANGDRVRHELTARDVEHWRGLGDGEGAIEHRVQGNVVVED